MREILARGRWDESRWDNRLFDNHSGVRWLHHPQTAPEEGTIHTCCIVTLFVSFPVEVLIEVNNCIFTEIIMEMLLAFIIETIIIVMEDNSLFHSSSWKISRCFIHHHHYVPRDAQAIVLWVFNLKISVFVNSLTTYQFSQHFVLCFPLPLTAEPCQLSQSPPDSLTSKCDRQ